MWTTNIVREISRAEGYEPRPSARLDEEPTVAYGVRHVQEQRPGIAVLKTHRNVPVLPRSAGIVTRRDIRDMVVSYMRFMGIPFASTLRFADVCLSRSPEVLYPGTPRLVLHHSEITGSPVEATRRLSTFLGVALTDEQIAAISAKFTKSAVKQRIDAADQAVRAKIDAGENIPASRLVVVSPKNWRVYDTATGFQTGHVSDYRDGDWRQILTPEQQDTLSALIDRHGRADG